LWSNSWPSAWKIDEEIFGHVTPFRRKHINPFGRYHFDLERIGQSMVS
jgi:hypothetical protein